MPGQIIRHWTHRLHHWYSMFAGTSYYHQPQNKGRAFIPGKLHGYFNDLTGKADWKGDLDDRGLPFNKLTSGQIVYFPVVLCQKALGHWDRWLMHSKPDDRQRFLDVAGWLVNKQDSEGGWDTWGLLSPGTKYRYSAMTQGEAVSVLVRAHSLTAEAAFEKACRRGLALMQKPVGDGGVCCRESTEVFLEEFPGPSRDTVLNGWLFALFGVYDYLLRFPDEGIKVFFRASLGSCVRSLESFDAGFWSYYSSGTKRLASPFYHQLHLGQLEALSQITSDPGVGLRHDKWKRYAESRIQTFRAVALKGMQKLREPSENTLVN
jgi:heparosan-N-sulfate-glucuronate 5-epimerase